MALNQKAESAILISVSTLILLFIGSLIGYFYAKSIFNVKIVYSTSFYDKRKIDSLQRLVTQDSIDNLNEIDYNQVYKTKIIDIKQKHKNEVKTYKALSNSDRLNYFKEWANKSIRDSSTIRFVPETNN